MKPRATRMAFAIFALSAWCNRPAPAQAVLPTLPEAATKPSSTRAMTGPHALVGEYVGSITAGGVTLRLGLKLEPDGPAGLKGVLDSIDQRAKIPIDTVTAKDG